MLIVDCRAGRTSQKPKLESYTLNTILAEFKLAQEQNLISSHVQAHSPAKCNEHPNEEAGALSSLDRSHGSDFRAVFALLSEHFSAPSCCWPWLQIKCSHTGNNYDNTTESATSVSSRLSTIPTSWTHRPLYIDDTRQFRLWTNTTALWPETKFCFLKFHFLPGKAKNQYALQAGYSRKSVSAVKSINLSSSNPLDTWGTFTQSECCKSCIQLLVLETCVTCSKEVQPPCMQQ